MTLESKLLTMECLFLGSTRWTLALFLLRVIRVQPVTVDSVVEKHIFRTRLSRNQRDGFGGTERTTTNGRQEDSEIPSAAAGGISKVDSLNQSEQIGGGRNQA